MKNIRRVSRLHVRLAAASALVLLEVASADAQLIPAPSGGAVPTIALSTDHGVPGAAITVSGVAPAGTAGGVRVQWLASAATVPVVEVALAGQAYSAPVAVPPDATPGLIEVCAGLTDVALAELACADFTVDQPAPAIVTGKLPPIGAVPSAAARAAAAVNPWALTTLQLVQSTGVTVATTVPDATGKFTFPPVAPGNYTMIQTGAGVKSAAPAGVSALAGSTTTIKPKLDLVPHYCPAENVPLGIANMRMQPSAAATNATFGTYFSGVPLPVHIYLDPAQDLFLFLPSFDAPPPPTTGLQGVRYDIRDAAGHLFSPIGTGITLIATFDVGQLSPGVATITPVPIIDGQPCTTLGTFQRTIRMIANPVPIGSFARPDSSISWRGGFSDSGFYRFNVIAPNLPGLPLSFPDPPITQVPGTSFALPIVIRDEFDASTSLKADVKLDGETTFRGLGAAFNFVLLDHTVLDEEASISPPGNIHINFLEPRKSSFDLNLPSLLPIRQEFTIYEGTIFDLFGIVQVIGALTAGFQGDVGLFSTIQPFVPNLSVTVVPEVAALGSVAAGLGALNFVSGGARLNTTIGIAVPFTARIDPFFLGAENPCGVLQASAEFFVRLSAGPITLLKISSPKYPIILPVGVPLYFPAPFCSLPNGFTASVAGIEAPIPLAIDETLDGEPSPLPAVNPAPALAVSAGGDRLRVYVDDATAGTDTITPRVVAQMQNPATGVWGAIVPLTDGMHFVAEPTVAWVGSGPGQFAVAAWSGRPTTIAEDVAIDDDIAALLNRQEISFATFQGDTWSAPVRLTSDLLADGHPVLAGDATGYTLVWVRDADGNPVTRTDDQLQVRDSPVAGSPTLASVQASGSMSVDPSVVRRSGQSLIAFTMDGDGDALTDGDRRIALARGSGLGFVTEVPASLPAGADSPSIAVTDDGHEWLAFLVRGLDDDGVSPIGDVSTRARVYSATHATPASPWMLSHTALPGGEGADDARGESPLLVTSGNTARMVFRSFDLNTALFGQLTVARVPGDGLDNAYQQLTFGDKQRWFPSAAIDPTTGELVVVSLDLPGLTAAPDDYGLITSEVPGQADPAVVELDFDPPYAAPGESVDVRAFVQNLGLADAPGSQLTVDFLDGPPGSGTVLDSYSLSGQALRIGVTIDAVTEITAAAGASTIWARVRTTGDDADPTNDVLSADLRSLPAPQNLQLAPAGNGVIEVTWTGVGPAPDDAVDETPPPTIGYRVARSDFSGGVLELAGESTTTAFRDALLVPGQAYCFVVTAYDATGVTSPPSAEACGDAPFAAANPGTSLLGMSLRLTDNATRARARALSIFSKDPGIAGLVPDTDTDPVLHGATLHVGSGFGDSFDGTYDLPARNWKYVKRRGVVQGFKYVDRDKNAPAGPVKSAVVNLGKNLRITARGAALVTALGRDPAPVDVLLEFGPQSYCMRFGGKTRHNPGKLFSAMKAPPPATCPIVPGG